MAKILIVIIALLAFSAPAIAASINITASQNLSLGQNIIYFTIQLDSRLNGTINVTASPNLQLQSALINVNEQDFLCSNVSEQNFLCSCQKSQVLNAVSTGQYIITAILSNSSGQLATNFKSGSIVDMSPPQVTLTSPSGIINTTLVSIYTQTDENSTCKGSFSTDDQSYEQMKIIMSGSGTSHWYSTTLPENDYLFYVKCRDSFNNTMPGFALISFGIDITPPTITDYAPKYSIPTDYTTLYVSTDEMASCVYNSSNSSAISLSTSDGLNHQALLQGLSEGMHYYTVMCTDIYGNRMAKGYTISFSVSMPVSADVDFSSPSPLKAGLYQVTLITSRSVIPTPQLNYNIGGTSGSIEFVGSGSTWKGYLIIPPDAGDKVGSFSFSGTDYYGQTGNLITSGKLFLVDTVPPAQPTISAFSNPDGSIGLMIRYDGEALSEFNIYRAGSAGVTLMNFYTNSSNASSFTDRQVSQGKTYYYAVSAVDQAGNEGSFSNEVSAVSMKSDSNSSQISPETLKSINGAMALADSSIQTVSQRISAISGSSDRDAIEATGILQDAGDAKTRLQNIYDSLNALKSSSGDDSDINSEVARQELAIRSIESSVPLDVKVTEYSPTSVQASGEDIASAISKASPQNSGDLNYLKNVNAAQSAISQKVSGKLVSAVYETSTQYFTFINEKITANQQVNDSTLVILIPKSVAEDTSKIDFITAGYSIIQNDPVVSFPYSSSSSGQSTTIEYVINGKASESDLSGIKAVLMENQNGSPSPATGNAVAETIKSNAKYIGIIIGMLVLGILAAYYFRMGKQRKDAFSSGSEIDSMIDDESGLIGENAPEKDFADTAKESRSAPESQQESKAYVSPKSIDDVLASLRAIPLEDLSDAQKSIVLSKIRRLEEIKAEQAGETAIASEEQQAQEFEEQQENVEIGTEPLQLYNGKTVRGLEDLRSALAKMDSDTFNYHVNYEKNDFAIWIKKCLKNRRLAMEMRKARSRQEAFSIVKKALSGRIR